MEVLGQQTVADVVAVATNDTSRDNTKRNGLARSDHSRGDIGDEHEVRTENGARWKQPQMQRSNASPRRMRCDEADEPDPRPQCLRSLRGMGVRGIPSAPVTSSP